MSLRPRVFGLAKTYGSGPSAYRRAIAKPVGGTVRVAVSGDELPSQTFTCSTVTGLVTLTASETPPPGASVTAGFEFDVPVRFDTDDLTIDLAAFAAGEIPHVPLIEIVP